MKINFTKEFCIALVEKAMATAQSQKTENKIRVAFEVEGVEFTGLFNSHVPGQVQGFSVFINSLPLMVVPVFSNEQMSGGMVSNLNTAEYLLHNLEMALNHLAQRVGQGNMGLDKQRILMQSLGSFFMAGHSNGMLAKADLAYTLDPVVIMPGVYGTITKLGEDNINTYEIKHGEKVVFSVTCAIDQSFLKQLLIAPITILMGLPVEPVSFVLDTEHPAFTQPQMGGHNPGFGPMGGRMTQTDFHQPIMAMTNHGGNSSLMPTDNVKGF